MGWGDQWQGEEPDDPAFQDLPPVAPKQSEVKQEYRTPRAESAAMEQWRLLGVRRGWRTQGGERIPPPELPKPVYIPKRGR